MNHLTPNPLPGLVFGGGLILLGLFMLRTQQKARAEFASQQHGEHERVFLRRRIRRREQVAGMILLIGIMIPVGDSLIPWQKALATFAIYWIIVLILALWIILLSFADITATRLHTSLELTRLKSQQQDLERVAQQIRESQQDSHS